MRLIWSGVGRKLVTQNNLCCILAHQSGKWAPVLSCRPLSNSCPTGNFKQSREAALLLGSLCAEGAELCTAMLAKLLCKHHLLLIQSRIFANTIFICCPLLLLRLLSQLLFTFVKGKNLICK